MIDTKELRVGNLVLCGDKITKVESIGDVNRYEGINFEVSTGWDGGYDIECMAPCNINPILLTEEWLIKFEFKRINNHLSDIPETWEKGFIKITNKGGKSVYFKGIHIKNVHSLQNLYFALTGNELQLK